jgi:membrane-bound inhibitor of C-type lysozyme
MIRPLIVCLLLISSLSAGAATLPCGGGGSRQVATVYAAADGKQLEACFDLDRNVVVVRLPDATVVTLPSAISASGARYSDGKQTFWEHQDVGRYFIGETLLFEGSPAPAAKQSPP